MSICYHTHNFILLTFLASNWNGFLKQKGSGYHRNNNCLATFTLGCKYEFSWMFQNKYYKRFWFFFFLLGGALFMVSWPELLAFLRHRLSSNYITINTKSPYSHGTFCWFSQVKEFCYLMKGSLFNYSEFSPFVERKIEEKEKGNPYICIMPGLKVKTLPIFLSKYIFLCQEMSEGLRTLLITELSAIVSIHLRSVRS